MLFLVVPAAAVGHKQIAWNFLLFFLAVKTSIELVDRLNISLEIKSHVDFFERVTVSSEALRVRLLQY